MLGKKQWTIPITFFIVGLMVSGLYIQNRKEVSGYDAVEIARSDNAPEVPKDTHNTRGSEELRQLSANYQQIRGGFSTHGFIDVDESNGYVYYHNSYRESRVYRYTSLANFKTNTGQQQLNMPRQSEGTYHCIYKNHLYYAAYNSNLLVKCRAADMGEALTRNLAGAGCHNRAHFNWGGYTDINLMSDETGLYVTWATSTSTPMKLSRLDENLNVLQTWDTGQNKGSVGWAFMVGGVLYWGNQYSSATFNYKLDTATSQKSTYSNSLGAGGYITHTSYNAKDNSLLVWNQGNVYHYPDIGGVRITRAESARLRGGEDYEGVCYARQGPYVMSVNVTTTETLDDASEMEVWLDYNTTNATLGFNWSREEFYKSGDTNSDVELLIDDCSFANDGEQQWTVNFTLIFNFTFPHEMMLDCYVKTTASNGESRLDRFKELCRIENDLEFLGTPRLVCEQQGRIEPGDWVKGDQNITVSNLTVVYSGSPSLYPDEDFFNVRIEDTSGNVWWDNESEGEEVELNIVSGGISDEVENYLITITNIPDSGICMTNFTFPVRIDAEPPIPPLNLLCHADSVKGRETEYTNEPETFVTWDEVEDVGSGLRGYFYCLTDNSGTENGSFTVDREIHIDELEEGLVRVYVWCVDNVGNIGVAESSGIQVDLTPPVFTNYTPVDGSWHNKSSVVCSVEVSDPEGSGVDGSTVEYSVSAGGHLNYATWMPAGLVEAGLHLSPSVEYYFPEGTENYIKWRAKDISGNGYVESLPTNVKVDITPVKFEDGISPNDAWYDRKDITTSIRLSDTGSGVDPSSVRVRTSRSGPNGFGRWRPVPQENVTKVENGVFEITVTRYYEEGKDNYVVFRGTDLAGNPYGISREFNLKIDISPVYFRAFSPDNESYSNEQKVECSIYLWDDGTGVDASSVEYSISTKGAGEENYGNWKKVPNVFPGNPAQVIIEVGFEWGRDNYIRFRANDVIGTGYNVSGEYMVWVNSEPAPEISSPVNGEEFPEGAEILFNASLSWDMDGDELSYYWTSNVTANRSLGHGSHFSARLVPGKHAITLHVSDGHGNNISKKLLLTIKEKEKEPEKTARDIITGKGGLNSFWLIFIITASVLVILAILVIFIVVRKRKKGTEGERPAPTYYPPFVPEHRPYPKGQYMPRMQQGYTGLASPGYAPVPPGQLMLPPGEPLTSPMTPAARMQFPQQKPALPAPYNSTVNMLPLPVNTAPSYSLPAFSTVQGVQDLNIPALPPAPVEAAGFDPAMMQGSTLLSGTTAPNAGHTAGSSPTAVPEDILEGSPTAPGQADHTAALSPPAISEDVLAGLSPAPHPADHPVETPPAMLKDILEGSPTAPGQADHTVALSPPAMSEDVLAGLSPAPHPADHPVETPPAMLEDVLAGLSTAPGQADNTADIVPPPGIESAFSFGPAVQPESDSTVADVGTLPGYSPLPGGSLPEPAPLPGPSLPVASSMQCHACGHVYSVTIIELPAIVMCPACLTQGMIASM